MHFFSKTLIAILTIPRCRGQLSGHIIPKKIVLIEKKKVYIRKNASRFFVCLLGNSVSERLEGENNICERYIFVEKKGTGKCLSIRASCVFESK